MDHWMLAKTPPMGWNSWDCYGASVTEAEIRANAAWMAHNLKAYGWEYVVVDIQWYEGGANSSRYRPFVPLEMDAWSRLIPSPKRFPSAAGGRGFGPLADYVHALGLKFGIHIMRGIPRQAVHAAAALRGTDASARDIAHSNSICPWNTDMYGLDATHPASQAYYDSLFALYAEWGVDFVKVDDIAASRLYGAHLGEMAMIRKAIDACGRGMVLSLSPGPAPLESAWRLAESANMWRITDDFWDRWDLLLDMFDRCERWYAHVGQGAWPDCDMLPLGRLGIRSVDGGGTDRQTRLTRDEQLAMMTLWTIFRSPLMLGGSLPDTDEWTFSLVSNPEVLDVCRKGSGSRPAFREGDCIAWSSDAESDGHYAAFFNVGESSLRSVAPLSRLGICGPVKARDLWKRQDIGTIPEAIALNIPSHGASLFRLDLA